MQNPFRNTARLSQFKHLVRQTLDSIVDAATNDAGPLQSVDIVLGVDTLIPTRENSYSRLVQDFKM